MAFRILMIILMTVIVAILWIVGKYGDDGGDGWI